MIAVAIPVVSPVGASAKTAANSKVPNAAKISNRATRKPQSPMRLTMKAFFPAADAAGLTNQKLISRYEDNPTSSHPTNITTKLEARTRVSIEAMNRFMYPKNRPNRSSPCMYPTA